MKKYILSLIMGAVVLSGGTIVYGADSMEVASLTSTEINQWIDKGYKLSVNSDTVSQCTVLKNKYEQEFSNYRRTECFQDGNTGYKYFICNLWDTKENCNLDWVVRTGSMSGRSASAGTENSQMNDILGIAEDTEDTEDTDSTSYIERLKAKINSQNLAKIETFLTKLQEKQSVKTKDDYIKYIDAIIGKLNTLKGKYSEHQNILDIVEYLKLRIIKIKLAFTKDTTEDSFWDEVRGGDGSEGGGTGGSSSSDADQGVSQVQGDTKYPWCDTPDIKLSNGQIWSACNVGATKAGTGTESYGNYFQFGKNDTTWTVGWTGNWAEWAQGPCAAGYHVPTGSEQTTSVVAITGKSSGWNSADIVNVQNTLKLAMAGLQNSETDIQDKGKTAYYWTSSMSSDFAQRLLFNTIDMNLLSAGKSIGLSVRCIKNPSSNIVSTPPTGPGNPSGTLITSDMLATATSSVTTNVPGYTQNPQAPKLTLTVFKTGAAVANANGPLLIVTPTLSIENMPAGTVCTIASSPSFNDLIPQSGKSIVIGTSTSFIATCKDRNGKVLLRDDNTPFKTFVFVKIPTPDPRVVSCPAGQARIGGVCQPQQATAGGEKPKGTISVWLDDPNPDTKLRDGKSVNFRYKATGMKSCFGVQTNTKLGSSDQNLQDSNGNTLKPQNLESGGALLDVVLSPLFSGVTFYCMDMNDKVVSGTLYLTRKTDGTFVVLKDQEETPQDPNRGAVKISFDNKEVKKGQKVVVSYSVAPEIVKCQTTGGNDTKYFDAAMWSDPREWKETVTVDSDTTVRLSCRKKGAVTDIVAQETIRVLNADGSYETPNDDDVTIVPDRKVMRKKDEKVALSYKVGKNITMCKVGEGAKDYAMNFSLWGDDPREWKSELMPTINNGGFYPWISVDCLTNTDKKVHKHIAITYAPDVVSDSTIRVSANTEVAKPGDDITISYEVWYDIGICHTTIGRRKSETREFGGLIPRKWTDSVTMQEKGDMDVVISCPTPTWQKQEQTITIKSWSTTVGGNVSSSNTFTQEDVNWYVNNIEKNDAGYRKMAAAILEQEAQGKTGIRAKVALALGIDETTVNAYIRVYKEELSAQDNSVSLTANKSSVNKGEKVTVSYQAGANMVKCNTYFGSTTGGSRYINGFAGSNASSQWTEEYTINSPTEISVSCTPKDGGTAVVKKISVNVLNTNAWGASVNQSKPLGQQEINILNQYVKDTLATIPSNLSDQQKSTKLDELFRTIVAQVKTQRAAGWDITDQQLANAVNAAVPGLQATAQQIYDYMKDK